MNCQMIRVISSPSSSTTTPSTLIFSTTSTPSNLCEKPRSSYRRPADRLTSSYPTTPQYSNLWQVEESFRITKSDLKIRPVYHWKPSRVKAHLAISFAALFLVRHLEYRVKVQYKKLSPKKIKELLLSVQHSTLVDKTRKIKYAIPSKTNVDINKLYRIMGLKKHTTPYILGKF